MNTQAYYEDLAAKRLEAARLVAQDVARRLGGQLHVAGRDSLMVKRGDIVVNVMLGEGGRLEYVEAWPHSADQVHDLKTWDQPALWHERPFGFVVTGCRFTDAETTFHWTWRGRLNGHPSAEAACDSLWRCRLAARSEILAGERRRLLDVDGPEAPKPLPGFADASARSDAVEDLQALADAPDIFPDADAAYRAAYMAEWTAMLAHRPVA